MIKALDTISDYINKFLQAVLAIISIVMVLVNLAQIAGRYLFSYSLPWSEELSVYMYVWIIFLSLHMLSREHAELTIDVIKFKSQKAEIVMIIFRELLALLTVVALFAASIIMIKNSMNFPQKTASLHLNTSMMYLCMPISFFLVILQKVTNIIKIVWRPLPNSDSDAAGAN